MKIDFIKHEMFILAMMGAFQHNKIYSNSIGETSKTRFRESLELLLNKKSEKYSTELSENDHIDNLVELKSEIEKKYKNILFDGKISFGTIQKLLNLYLKYLWSIDLIATPPHCPIDRKILEKIKDNSTKWTKIELREYRVVIDKIRKIKGDYSFAEWELIEFNKKRVLV